MRPTLRNWHQLLFVIVLKLAISEARLGAAGAGAKFGLFRN